MKLKKLEIHGFKSFADRTEIVFDQGITGIVGPNGSGKSNIGDAVRWVLGEQSARVLRGAKMEDVIFNGTEKRKAAGYCEVTLTFDNEDGALKSSYAEVSVTRRVYRSGDSEYYLNRTACRLKDILELFRDTGIGREGYSLIGQGRIDEILSVKSEDRRQIFEEAAGVMTYRVRKEEAERKLARTVDNLDRANDILEELENRIEPLSRQAETAKEYLEIAEKLKYLELNVFLLRHDKLKERIAALQQTVDGLNDVILNREASINEIGARREELDEAIRILEEELAVARAAHLSENDVYHAAKSARELTAQQLDQEKEQITNCETELETQRKHREELAQLYEKGTKDTEKSRSALESAEAEVKSRQARLDEAIADAEQKERALDEHKADILNFVNRMSEAKNQQARKQAMCEQMKVRLQEIENGMLQLLKEKDELDENLQKAKGQKEAVDAELLKLREEAARAEGHLRLAVDEAREIRDEAQKKNATLQGDKSRLHLMEEMNREMEGYSGAVRKALKFAENDPAVYGAVARLIKVPREMETAIDMVLGAALQNIVTRDEEAAKRMIDYLRLNKLGRATFLPIASMHGRVLTNEERRLLNMPGCLGVASELIEFDEKFRGIIENLLGRTVIAKDLDSGIAIMRAGRHSFRLVTLEGDVMHSGGSMTGGTATSKAVSLLSRERETEELRESVINQETALKQLQDRFQKILAEREELTRIRAESDEAVRQEEIAAAREQERLFNATAELNAHTERIRQTEQARTQLNESIAELTEDLKEAESESRNVDIDRSAMDEKTEYLQLVLKDAREKTERLREEAQSALKNYAELEHALDILRRDSERRDEDVEKADRRIQELCEQLQGRLLHREALEKKLEGQSEYEEDVLASVRTKALEVDRLESTRKSKSDEQRECVNAGEEAHRLYDEEQKRLHRNELSLSNAEGELKTMCDRIFNTYELTYAGAEEYRQTEGFNLSESEKEAAGYRSRIREMGPVNVGAIEEYADTKQRYDEMNANREDLLKAKSDLESLIARLLGQMERQFVDEFAKLQGYFRETFTRLFGGGQAELRLGDPNDALNCGIEIIAQPPGKKLQLLSLLSGGERALTAIAILFAMLKLKPTPFCILDEIEAALDEANIGYFADYLSEYAKDTQFVVVTHRKGTMERCDGLYGVAMQEKGVSRMVSVDLKDYE